MPANDGQVRELVASAEEAAALIEALPVLDSAGALRPPSSAKSTPEIWTQMSVASSFVVVRGAPITSAPRPTNPENSRAFPK